MNYQPLAGDQKLPGFDPNQAITGNSSGDLINFLQYAFSFLIWTTIILAMLAIVVGGFYYFASAGNAARATEGRERIKWAIYGLVLALSSWVILNFINPDLVKPNLPGLTPIIPVGIYATLPEDAICVLNQDGCTFDFKCQSNPGAVQEVFSDMSPPEQQDALKNLGVESLSDLGTCSAISSNNLKYNSKCNFSETCNDPRLVCRAGNSTAKNGSCLPKNDVFSPLLSSLASQQPCYKDDECGKGLEQTDRCRNSQEPEEDGCIIDYACNTLANRCLDPQTCNRISDKSQQQELTASKESIENNCENSFCVYKNSSSWELWKAQYWKELQNKEYLGTCRMPNPTYVCKSEKGGESGKTEVECKNVAEEKNKN